VVELSKPGLLVKKLEQMKTMNQDAQLKKNVQIKKQNYFLSYHLYF
jgi:hypothetical protein